MKPIIRKLKASEEGYALLVTILVLFMLTIIGISATTTSNIELQISANTKKIAEEFYNAEGAMITTIEKTDWLSNEFLKDGEKNASWAENVDFDGKTGKDAYVEIRCITTETDDNNKPVKIKDLSTNANDLPVDSHLTPPPPDSGYSAVNYEIRKYGVTSTALRNGKKIGAPLQAGVWKEFNNN